MESQTDLLDSHTAYSNTNELTKAIEQKGYTVKRSSSKQDENINDVAQIPTGRRIVKRSSS